MKTEKKPGAVADPCADGCKRGCWHDRNTKTFPKPEEINQELLARLKQSLAYLEHPEAKELENCAKPISLMARQVRAAIAKAEGREVV